MTIATIRNPWLRLGAGSAFVPIGKLFGQRRSTAWSGLRLLATMIGGALHSGAPAAARQSETADARLTAARFRDRMIPHLDAAHNLARYLSRDPDAAQDIVQDAYLRAFRSFATYRGDGDRAWILAIVRNCHLDWRARTKQAEILEPLADDRLEDVDERRDLPVADSTPEADLLRLDEAARVRRHLEALPEAFREILVLREVEDLSYREIADVTGLPMGTVMSRLARARKLFQQGWTFDDSGRAG